jgi:hypothetical protein
MQQHGKDRMAQYNTARSAGQASRRIPQKSPRYLDGAGGFGVCCTYQWMTTRVPMGDQLYSQAASARVRLTHPWLIGVPKLLCQ